MSDSLPQTNQPEIDKKAATARAIGIATEKLDHEIPDWRTIVGVEGSKNPYRQWLAKQSAEYQTEMASTNSAASILRSIAKFRSDAE